MKISTPLSILALTVSLFTLYRTETGTSSQATSDVAADKALRKREAEIVKNFAPKFQEMFADLDGSPGKDWDPKTLEELFAPVIRITESMQN